MRYLNNHIDNLVKGVFEYEKIKLNISEKKLELSIDLDKPTIGYFSIKTTKDQKVKGVINASSPRMKCSIREFEANEIEVRYEFNSKGMEEGEVLTGDIFIISNAGEYSIPFTASVIHKVIQSSIGKIKNLFHFTNLAQSNFEEAVKIFYSQEFKHVFINNDKKFYNTYLGLSGIKDSRQNMEEFLISIHKKRAVEIDIPEEMMEIPHIKENMHIEFPITRIGWGFTNIEINTDQEFVKLQKSQLTDDDFLGNKCSFSCELIYEKLHAGKNYARIQFKTPFAKKQIEICVVQGKIHKTTNREIQKIRLLLTRQYLDFRLKKINIATWVKESMYLVEKMIGVDGTSIEARLYQTQLLLASEKFKEAQWILEHVNQDMNIKEANSVLNAYFMYLTCLADRENSGLDKIKETIRSFFMEQKQNNQLLWLLLYLDDSYEKNPSDKLTLLEEQFKAGCTSPILYIEAYHLFVKNPLLLSKLEDYEIQVLLWAHKNQIYSENIVNQVVYLCTRTKKYSDLLHKILSSYYMKYENNEILMIIGSHLMRGNRMDQEAFFWYKKAVEKELRITRLFEYYMYAMPPDSKEELPRMIKMYFAYNSSLDFQKNAILYANLIAHQENNKEIVTSYEKQMVSFTIEQLRNNRMNEDLAVLYEYFREHELIQKELPDHLEALAFSSCIVATDSKMKYAIVIEDPLIMEQKVPIINKKAYVNLYGHNYEIILEDENGNRYLESTEFKIYQMMRKNSLQSLIQDNMERGIGFCVYLSELKHHFQFVQGENEKCIRLLIESPWIREDFKVEMRQNIIQYYYDCDKQQELDEFLLSIQPSFLQKKNRAELVEYMVKRGMHENAYQIVTTYGLEHVGVKILVKLCSQMIRNMEYERDDVLLKISHMVFELGKYDQMVLNYLILHYEGTTRNLRNIWKAAVNFDMDVHSLEERMLIQMLYTRSFVGERDRIFDDYQKNGALPSLEMAYLSFHAFEYFILDSILEDGFFTSLIFAYKKGAQLNDICKLAFAKYLSEKMKEREPNYLCSEETKSIACLFIKELIHKNIIFAFYKEYEDMVEEISLWADKTFIEHKANPNSRITLHYVLESEEEENVTYRKEEMKNMFGGVFSKQFTMFFGENLQYYITEDCKGKEHLSKSLVIQKNDITMGGKETRYDVMNDMLISKALNDEESLLNLMELYIRKKQVTEKIFKLK